jgi:hypothetical protein
VRGLLRRRGWDEPPSDPERGTAEPDGDQEDPR